MRRFDFSTFKSRRIQRRRMHGNLNGDLKTLLFRAILRTLQLHRQLGQKIFAANYNFQFSQGRLKTERIIKES